MARLRVDDRERGAVSVFVLGLVVVLMIVAGLVVDGGRAVNARAEITDDAEQAARAGANQVDVAALRSGEGVSLSSSAARAAAMDHLLARGYDAGRIQVDVVDQEVSVQVSDRVPTALLSLILISHFNVEGSAVARAALGIDSEITGPP